jgi:aminoglycoside phosphotransferase family enzyme
LAAKVSWLSRPTSYPERTDRVTTRETHMAWVFLTNRYAYKLKKPVRLAYLDFTTVGARHRVCLDEVRLNRRLAATVYLGVVPLCLTAAGALTLGVVSGEGAVAIDWLVRMRRLPGRLMLDRLILAGKVTRDRIAALGRTLADFHQSAPRCSMADDAYLDRLGAEIDANRREVLRLFAPVELAESAFLAQREFIDRHGDLLRRRAADDRIVEGHGDLRPEHVCLASHPAIIDCVEFNRDFRILDSMDDVAYLSMECRRLGAGAIGDAIIASVRAAGGDDVPDAVLRFYRSFRAGLRAKIALWRLEEPDVAEPEKWRRRAATYLAIARDELTARTVP